MRLFSVPYTQRGTSYLPHRLGFIPGRAPGGESNLYDQLQGSCSLGRKVGSNRSHNIYINLCSDSLFQQDECIELDTILVSRRY